MAAASEGLINSQSWVKVKLSSIILLSNNACHLPTTDFDKNVATLSATLEPFHTAKASGIGLPLQVKKI